jgi:hypothetical protein
MLHYSLKHFMSSLVHCLCPRGKVLRVRYEDLVRQPVTEIKRFGQFSSPPMESVIDKLMRGEFATGTPPVERQPYQATDNH